MMPNHTHLVRNNEVIQTALQEQDTNGALTASKIQFEKQPPNSPDNTKSYKCLFNAAQSVYPRMEIVEMVQKIFNNYPPTHTHSNSLFVTLMSIYNCIIEHYDDNLYKVPHINNGQDGEGGCIGKVLF